MTNEDIRDAINAFESDDDDDLGDALLDKLKQVSQDYVDEPMDEDFADEDLDDDYDEDDDGEDEISIVAIADDPVRMYLKEIGQVPLLDTNREMWLSAQIASERLVQDLIDELASLDRLGPDGEHTLPSALDTLRHAYQYLRNNWQE